MSEDAILERFDRLEQLIARLAGERLTRAQMLARYGISAKTLDSRIQSGEVAAPHRDEKKWLLYRVLEREHERRRVPAFVVRRRGHHLYRHFDESGILLYVGISVHAVSRLVGHKRTSPWIWSVARMDVQSYPTRRAAEIAEKHAIETEAPLFNVKYGDHMRRAASLERL